MNSQISRCLISVLLYSTVAVVANAQTALFHHVVGDAAQGTARLHIDSNVVANIRNAWPAEVDLVVPHVGVQHYVRTQMFASGHTDIGTYVSRSADAFTTLVLGPSATIVSIVKGASLTTVGPARDGNGYAVVTVPLAGGADCGTHEAQLHSAVIAAMHAAKVGDNALSDMDTLVLRVAVEIDPSVVRATASNEDLARTYATSLMAVVGQIFERDIAMRLRITSMRVADSDSTPYPRFGNVFGYIDSAVRYAEKSLAHVERDMMLFLVARGAAGGIAASIGGLCMPALSYCAADVNGTPVPDLPTWSWDASVVAHEMGHVLGGVHTQSCLWPGGPLDSCVQSESGTCVTFMQTRAAMGTIMSYCHQRRSQGGGVAMEFHANHRRVMRAMAEAAACVGNRSATQRSAIVGKVLLRDTDVAMPSVELRLQPWNFSYVQGTPSSQGNTHDTSRSNGDYAFTGLGMGLYSIELPSNVNLWPITLSSAKEISPVIVAADTAYWPLRIAPATPVHISVIDLPAHQAVRMHIVHRNTGLTSYASTVSYTDEQRDEGILLDRGLPAGNYSFVPVARGYRFEPDIIRLNVHQQSDTIRLLVRAVPVDTAGVHCTVVAVTFNSDGTSTLVPHQEVEMRVGDDDGRILEFLRTDDVGVATVLLDSAGLRRTLRARWDTTEWVDATPPDVLVNHNGSFLYYVNRKRRSEPLIVRPRVFEKENRAYTSLPDDAIVHRPTHTTGGYLGLRHLPPFDVRIRGKAFDSTWAYINGYLTGGPNPVYDWEGRSVTSYEPSELVLAPFSTRLAYVRDSTRTSTLRVRTVGESPRRWWEVEWNNMGIEYRDTSRNVVVGGTATFTLRVQEETGTVEMHYGTIDVPQDVRMNVEVGMRGADNFDRLLVEPVSEQDPSWTNVEVTTGYVDGRTTLVAMPGNVPATGTVFRFIDPVTTVGRLHTQQDVVCEVVEGRLMIKGAHSQGHVTMFDLGGRMVASAAVADGRAGLDVQRLPQGLYFVWWHSSGGSALLPVILGR